MRDKEEGRESWYILETAFKSTMLKKNTLK